MGSSFNPLLYLELGFLLFCFSKELSSLLISAFNYLLFFLSLILVTSLGMTLVTFYRNKKTEKLKKKKNDLIDFF